MKKKFLYGIAVLIIAVVVAINVNLNSKGDGLSDVSLANVEALAQSESGGNKIHALYDCGSGCLCCGSGNVRECSEGEMC